MPQGGRRCEAGTLRSTPSSRLFCTCNAKVLVVDDAPELVRMLGQTLGAAGFAAVGAESGERALELVGEQEFDAAVVGT